MADQTNRDKAEEMGRFFAVELWNEWKLYKHGWDEPTSAPSSVVAVLEALIDMARAKPSSPPAAAGAAFEEFWATTGPWPDNILGAAFKELAHKAFTAGVESGRAMVPICGQCLGDLPEGQPTEAPDHDLPQPENDSLGG